MVTIDLKINEIVLLSREHEGEGKKTFLKNHLSKFNQEDLIDYIINDEVIHAQQMEVYEDEEDNAKGEEEDGFY